MQTATPAEAGTGRLDTVRRIEVPAPRAPGGTCNAYLLGGDRPAVVDPGPPLPATQEALTAGLRDLGLSLNDIGPVIVTHAHLNHAGLGPWLANAAGQVLSAHPLALADLSDWSTTCRRRLDHLRRAATAAGVPRSTLEAALAESTREEALAPHPVQVATQALEHGAHLRLGNQIWQVLYSPGHSPDHLGLVLSGGRIQLVGDLVLRDHTTLTALSPHRATVATQPVLQQLIDSWRTTARLPTSTAWTGHGAPVRAYRILVARRMATLRDRLRTTRSLVAAGAGTVWEIATGLSSSLAPEDLATTIGQVGTLAEWLVWRGLLTRTYRDGIAHYQYSLAGATKT